MRRSLILSSAITGLLLVVLLQPGPRVSLAQDGAPAAQPVTGSDVVVARGLTNPRGMAWDASGNLYVALAGAGGANQARQQSPASQAIGPFRGGMTAGVAKIVNGCPVIVAGNLPSYTDKLGEAAGVAAVAWLNGQLYALDAGGGVTHGAPGTPSGIYQINPDGTSVLVANLSLWIRTHPVAHVPPDYDPDSSAFAMIAGNDRLWVVESNSGQVLTVLPASPTAVITRVVDLSEGHPVPTGLAPATDGGVYVANLTTQPFTDDTAKVIHVASNGTVTDVWTGLTMVTSLAVGADGTLYAAEMATGNTTQPPFIKPGTGKIVRQTGAHSAADVATGLTFPVGLTVGPGNDLYVSLPAVGADHGEGQIVRIPVATGVPLAMMATTPAAACPASTAPAATPEIPAGEGGATPTA